MSFRLIFVAFFCKMCADRTVIIRMTNIYIGFGSNRGGRKKNILKALALLESNNLKILKISSFYETAPYGFKNQKKFLNGVVKLKMGLPPGKLLGLCKKIEKEVGRVPSRRWGPREIDLDIIFYGKKIFKSRKLSIPHADLHNRKFVLISLKEIAPGFVHPALKKTVSSILRKLID